MTETDGSAQADSLANDLIRGAKAISKFIHEDERKTYYLLEKRLIPAGKEGAIWIASRRALRAHYARLTGGEAAA